MSRLKSIALLLSGSLASMLFCGLLIVGHIDSEAAVDENRPAIVSDSKIDDVGGMPLWLQTDPQWRNIP